MPAPKKATKPKAKTTKRKAESTTRYIFQSPKPKHDYRYTGIADTIEHWLALILNGEIQPPKP